MFCPIGLALYEQYEVAERERNELTARRDAAVEAYGPPVNGRELQAAKQRYVEKYADWLGHKAFCQDCKPKAPARGDVRDNAPGK